ncbi:MAG: hypothetical protein KJ077_40385 [Anaerolineae bacterium]|nr:hypothetical protein [Anaerolineae bacterium]
MSELAARLPDESEQMDELEQPAQQRDKQEIVPLGDSGESLPLGNSRWQDIIWREWRASEDAEYARQLFNLVANEPVGWRGVAGMALLGTLYGELAGLLLRLLLTADLSPLQLNGVNLSLFVWLGGLLGGVIALLISGLRLSWQTWLAWLTPSPFFSRIGRSAWPGGEWWVGVLVGLGGLGVGIGALMGFLVAILTGRKVEVGRGNEYAVGALFGALAGVLGTLAGSLAGQGDNLGAGLGLLLGAWAGAVWGSGLIGLVAGWASLLISWLFFGVNDGVIGWLGFSLGYGVGVTLKVLGGQRDWANLYSYRSWYFWWRGQPSVAKVEAALQRLLAQVQPETWPVWRQALHYLQEHKDQPGEPERFIGALQSPHWADRFAARHILVALGGEAVEPLHQLAAEANPLQQMAMWLLAQIEQETTNRLGWRSADLLCPHCLARFGPHPVNLAWGVSFTYYGCRLCRQSRQFIAWLKAVAVLDTNSAELYQRREDELRVNWIQRRALFDFEWVEIIRAGDEAVERFAVQVGNDTDPFRKPRYQQMTCVIGPACQLSTNTLRILRRTFGEVMAYAPHV